MRPNPHIALIYHYDLARALAGEVVDWQAIPVNVDAGREGGDLCRAAADFAKRRDLFAMPAPSSPDTLAPECHSEASGGSPGDRSTRSSGVSAVPAPPTVVEQQAADPEPALASCPVPGAAVNLSAEDWEDARSVNGTGQRPTVSGPAVIDELRVAMAWDRACLIARIKDLVDQGHESLIRQHWPEGVPTLKHDGHSDAQLQLILACVRRVEAEVGAGWHPDDGPPPHVNTDPRASIEYPAATPDEGGSIRDIAREQLDRVYRRLDRTATDLCIQIAQEAHAAGRSISVAANPTLRRWSIARAVIAWAASGRTLDDLWFAASNLATFEQCRDPSATLGGLISQFDIQQADRLYQAATPPE